MNPSFGEKSCLHCDTKDVDQVVISSITDTSVDKAEVRNVYMLIYAFKHEMQHMLFKAANCSIFIMHLLLITIFSCIIKQTKTSLVSVSGSVKSIKPKRSLEEHRGRRGQSESSGGSSFIQTYIHSLLS